MPLDTTIRISGLNETRAALQRMNAEVEAAGRRFVTKGALVIQQESRAVFNPRPLGSRQTRKFTDGSGNEIKRVKYKGAANPNRRPTNRSGNLQRSIQTDVRSEPTRLGRLWKSETGPTMKYGRRVELGMSSGQGSDAYPYMGRGFSKARPIIHALARVEYRTVIRG